MVRRYKGMDCEDCTVRNFLICLMLYSPREALLQILPMWTFIRIWASNQDPRFRTLSKGLMTVSPMIIDSIDVFSSCWRVPIIRKLQIQRRKIVLTAIECVKNKKHFFLTFCFLSLRVFIANKACFKRCAIAVLSWLDCSSTTARHQHDLDLIQSNRTAVAENKT